MLGKWLTVGVSLTLLASLSAAAEGPASLGGPPAAPSVEGNIAARGAAKPTPAGSVAAAPKSAVAPARYLPDRFAGRAGAYYRLRWGIDSLSVRWAESGEIIRFSYQVLDADKATVLNSRRYDPSLIDPKAGVSLVVPTMDQVGQLRQSGTPEAGKSYWIAFSNKGRLVKKGDRVSVVIGQFRADGLVID